MRFGSVCSGIEAASTAWKPLGWTAAWLAEIEPFPSAVLKHHYPDVPNYGDMTKFKEWNAEPIDLLCGGTPCQSFSVAGLRKGLDDPRGNLMLTFGAIADHFRPKWLVWENVPGVLSSNGGRDFGSFLWMLGKLGYGFAYRVLDAQYFGVPQRRRRVFVVGCLGDWRSAAAVLFERDSLQGNPAPSRETGKVAPTIPSRSTAGGGLGTDFDCDGGLTTWPTEVAQTLDAHYGDKMGLENQHINAGGGCSSTAMCLTTKVRIDAESETLIPTLGGHFSYGIPGNWIGRKPENGGNAVEPMIDVSPCLTGTDRHGVATTQYGDIAASLTARHDSSLCADRGMNVIAFSTKDYGTDATEDLSPTLRAMPHHGSHANGGGQLGIAQPIAFHSNAQAAQLPTLGRDTSVSDSLTRSQNAAVAYGFQPRIARNGRGDMGDKVNALTSQAGETGKGDAAPCVAQSMAVRRLTPTECERLMGFPDGYTNIPWRGKPKSPDGPRYKALGNSWAVPVVRWIGERIQQVDTLR